MESFRFRSFKVDRKRARNILENWFKVTEKLPLSCFSAFVLNGKTVYILLTNTSKHTSTIDSIVKKLSTISDKTTKSEAQPLSKALKAFYGRRDPLFCKNASVGLYKNFGDISDCINKVIDAVISTPGMILQINTLGGNIQRSDFEEASVYAHREFFYISELQIYWNNSKRGKLLLEKFGEVQKMFAADGSYAQYRNYPDINLKNWEKAYFGKNYKRLQKVKNKYDPNNVFRGEQTVRNSR